MLFSSALWWIARRSFHGSCTVAIRIIANWRVASPMVSGGETVAAVLPLSSSLAGGRATAWTRSHSNSAKVSRCPRRNQGRNKDQSRFSFNLSYFKSTSLPASTCVASDCRGLRQLPHCHGLLRAARSHVPRGRLCLLEHRRRCQGHPLLRSALPTAASGSSLLGVFTVK